MNKLVQAVECTTGTCGHMSHQLIVTSGLFLLAAVVTLAIIQYYAKD